MVENYLFLTVKLAVCGYVLYKAWVFIFDWQLYGLWDNIPLRQKKEIQEPDNARMTENDVVDVIGATKVVYLEDPELAAKVPAHSEKLEPSGYIGEEPDITDDEVESDLPKVPKKPEEVLEEHERFEALDDLAPGLDPDFSIGLTYEEMANAVGVLTDATDNEKQIIEAAKTIHRIKDTDLFEFFSNQVSNLDNIQKLMDDCLDVDGNPLPVRKSKRRQADIKSFDLKDYI